MKKDDVISRAAAIDAVLSEERYCERNMDDETTAAVQMARFKLEKVPVVDVAPVVRCRDCKHRPTDNRGTGEDCTNFAIEFPDGLCPCQCEEDGWYNWYPPDDWFCANGEHREITQ